MRLLEYESKEILMKYKIPTPPGQLISSAEEIKIDGPVMLKAQIPSGGRGKAGGILEVSSQEETKLELEKLFSTQMKGYRPKKG